MYSSFKKQIISSFNVILVFSEIKHYLSIIESQGLNHNNICKKEIMRLYIIIKKF